MGVQSSLGVGVWVVYPCPTACCCALVCFECEDTSICVCNCLPVVEEGGGIGGVPWGIRECGWCPLRWYGVVWGVGVP